LKQNSTVTLQPEPAKKHQHNYISTVKHFDGEVFLNDLLCQHWCTICSSNVVDTCTELFLEMFSSVLQVHAPLKRKRVKKQIQPVWFNSDISKAIKQRNQNKQNSSAYKYFRKK